MKKSKAKELVTKLKEKDMRMAIAESMTCGLASYGLSAVIGTSEVFLGSVVCYDEQVKVGLLKVPRATLTKYTAESQQVTDTLAIGLPRLFENADIFCAITGLASPGGSESPSKPVGTVFFSVFYREKIYRLRKRYYGTALQIKKKACRELYAFALSVIKSN